MKHYVIRKLYIYSSSSCALYAKCPYDPPPRDIPLCAGGNETGIYDHLFVRAATATHCTIREFRVAFDFVKDGFV